MARVKFVPDPAGYRAVMRSMPMQATVYRYAQAIADDASDACSADTMRNEPFMADHGVDAVAAYAHAFSATPHGRYAQAKNKVLTKAMNRKRG